MAFGQILNEVAREGGPLADRIVTTAPGRDRLDQPRRLGEPARPRAREALADTFKAERIPSTFAWEFSPSGQHLELGIAEANLMTMLSALGLSHQINGRAAAAGRHGLRPLRAPGGATSSTMPATRTRASSSSARRPG